ncbi:hypothetical protein KQX54_003981 [Cotesia glomerata]|uniref:Secreted protein n=1 Tax=Cotesia glomerata TaxID=32391 RepID=A0AAV7IX83_COTGL|nr:hypothetical protein KQX54_003981 [Cotesia glomerata]
MKRTNVSHLFVRAAVSSCWRSLLARPPPNIRPARSATAPAARLVLEKKPYASKPLALSKLPIAELHRITYSNTEHRVTRSSTRLVPTRTECKPR